MKSMLRMLGAGRLYDRLTGLQDENWSRVVMRREQRRMVESLCPGNLETLEISGTEFHSYGFKRYRTEAFPSYDICDTPLDDSFDLIIAEQVFEHLLWPYRAGKNVLQMLRPGGHFLVSTPFLVRVHNIPTDCSRWTETGLRYFLAECGFPLQDVVTGSWGNRACVKANFARWIRYRSRLHSLVNEPDYPYHVWAVARKGPG